MRRSPALTRRMRDFAESYLLRYGWWPYSLEVVREVPEMTEEQARDAIWSPAADEWRRDVLRRYNERRHTDART